MLQTLSNKTIIFIWKNSIFGIDIQLFKLKKVTHYQVCVCCILLEANLKIFCKLSEVIFNVMF